VSMIDWRVIFVRGVQNRTKCSWVSTANTIPELQSCFANQFRSCLKMG
jgi:hypothetical protein